MKSLSFVLIPLFVLSSLLFGMTYESGSQAIGPNTNIRISTLTASGLSVSTGTISIITLSSATVSTMFQIPSNAAPRTNVTPSAVGQIILNTGSDPDEVCYSTGTTRLTWTQMHTAGSPCAN